MPAGSRKARWVDARCFRFKGAELAERSKLIWRRARKRGPAEQRRTFVRREAAFGNDERTKRLAALLAGKVKSWPDLHHAPARPPAAARKDQLRSAGKGSRNLTADMTREAARCANLEANMS